MTIQIALEDDQENIVATLSIATWRYLGDRAAGDLAYCHRFGVRAAPGLERSTSILRV